MATLEKPVFDYDRSAYSDQRLEEIHRALLFPRMVEEKMLTQLRKGKISKWFAGIGQEANAVGAALAMRKEEYMLPMIRNLGVFTTRGVPLERLFEQFQGKEGGFTQGRDRSFHFGTNEYGLVGMISHLGPQMGVADGIGLASKLAEEEKATLVFSGEGGTSEGDFHEALNVAAVWELPVIFLIENNGYGLSTPTNEQFKCERLADRGIGYGVESYRIEGNNILEVHQTLNEVAERIRKKPEPVLIESMTFRMRGHEEASGTKYVPQELFDEWGKKDPVDNFERFMLQEGILTEKKVQDIRRSFEKEIDDALKKAFKAPYREADRERELGDVYASAPPSVFTSENGKRSEKRYIDAISEGLWQGMEQFRELILMGQDIAEYGGAFKVTEGFVEGFGRDRVRNTPLCESAILGAALGLSVRRYKSMVEMQFADFITSGFNQVVNNLAKSHYRWGQNADTVIRMPSGGGVGGAPFHSQSTESWFAHTPGLKVVMPAFPDDAKGLLLSALEDPNPVLYYEHKMLYRSVKGEVSDEPYTVPIGKARKVREGHDLSIITYGAGVHWAMEALDENPDISADLVDLRSLSPYDEEAILETVRKTNKAVVLHEPPEMGSIGAEWVAFINEHCFEELDAPVRRIGALHTPVPFAAELEADFLPKERFKKALRELWEY